MLTKIQADNTKPVIIKTVDGEDVSRRSSFPSDKKITFTVKAPRRLGASAVVLRVESEGAQKRDFPLEFTSSDLGADVYRVTLSPEKEGFLRDGALLRYEFLFLRGFDTLFTNTTNNVDFELSERSGAKFRMLIYDAAIKTPDWFKGRIMYHIFVDRFFKGEGEVTQRDDAVMESDWKHGIPQYPKENGDRYSNNVFFGGNLWGVIEKLDYLSSLNVGVIYLSPIFKAYSNHKYDTGNYLEVDGMFGGDEAFDKLISEADKRGIKIILDGVFNHTGDDSLYFDRYGKYGKTGAYTNPNSPFYDWFKFKKYPEEYESWWGIDILPKLNHENPSCRDFFIGKGGVVRKYLERGIDGWRLDVADELTNDFLDTLKSTALEANPEALIIGEVWENAADKISFGVRKRYFDGAQLDSVMNYPVKNAIIDFLKYRDAEILGDTLTELYSMYPRCVCDCLMNILGTHDTERILTVLGVIADESLSGDNVPNDELAVRRMNKKQRDRAEALLKMAAVIQYTVFGVPSVYYADEVGMEGYHDPFCRMPFPWGRESRKLLSFYKKLGEIRTSERVFAKGDFEIVELCGGFIAYTRRSDKQSLIIAVNRGENAVDFLQADEYTELISGEVFDGKVKPDTAVILKRR